MKAQHISEAANIKLPLRFRILEHVADVGVTAIADM